MAELSQEELDERVALLKRFKTLLTLQRDKFQEYLTVLEKQQKSITAENPETLLAHTELEQQIVKNITSLQKAIVPMSKMYESSKDGENLEIAKIQGELTELQAKVLHQNQLNRDLLRVHIGKIRNQLQNLKNPYKANKVYASPHHVATMVQVEV